MNMARRLARLERLVAKAAGDCACQHRPIEIVEKWADEPDPEPFHCPTCNGTKSGPGIKTIIVVKPLPRECRTAVVD